MAEHSLAQQDRDLPKAGDPREEAVPKLLARFGGRLHALARRICRSEEDADDLVQEVFLTAWRSWDGFEGRANPSSWLWKIAVRACQRMHRRRKGEPERMASLEELSPFGASEMPDVRRQRTTVLEDLLMREGRERMEEAVAELPMSFRVPLVLKDIVGFSIDEVASILGIKPATVKTRLHRARMKLRSAIEEHIPRRPAQPAAYSQQVCLDLLKAKQEALDRGVAFPDDEIICERCREVFASLDLAHDLCTRLGADNLPKALVDQIHEKMGIRRAS